MKLGWVVTCTTHCPGQFFLLLSKFLVWPFSQFGPWYMLMPQVHEARRVQPHFHKAGLNWSKSGSNHLLFIQNQVPHTAHTVHTTHHIPANPFLFYLLYSFFFFFSAETLLLYSNIIFSPLFFSLFFFSQHIFTFLVDFKKFRLFDGCYPIGALGGRNVFICKQVQVYKSLFLPGTLFSFPT